MNNKLYKKLLWGTGFVIVAVILTLFIMSQTYIQNLVYHERLNQMEEVTHQMFRSLEDVIDTHWDEVNVQCNYLYCTPLKTDTEFYRYLKSCRSFPITMKDRSNWLPWTLTDITIPRMAAWGC